MRTSYTTRERDKESRRERYSALHLSRLTSADIPKVSFACGSRGDITTLRDPRRDDRNETDRDGGCVIKARIRVRACITST